MLLLLFLLHHFHFTPVLTATAPVAVATAAVVLFVQGDREGVTGASRAAASAR